MNDAGARRAVEHAARESYGRLLAFLAARSRDVAAAEDALADAFHAALEHWPRDGVPDKPEAWLLTAARRRLLDEARRHRTRSDAATELIAAAEQAQALIDTPSMFPDERLQLLFICAHPAIDAAARTPLMLQTVLGLDAARIASAFLVQPSAMGQRLSRAKAKIRDAAIGFDLPLAAELPARLEAVLEAIYAAYGSGWEDLTGADSRRRGLAREAIDLGRVLLALLPGEPEVSALLALMLYCESRRDSRRDAAGAYVPLSQQDVARWSQPLIEEAHALLEAASRSGKTGRFQLEAAIQSVHAYRCVTGRIDWDAIATLYEALVRIAPTIGALVGRAAAIAEARGADSGWGALQEIPAPAVVNYQAYWALAAHLLRRLQRGAEADDAYQRAIGLCEDGAMREFLLKQLLANRRLG
jgi:RNA polymerase sigma-70 factor (ECF subfamily)